VGFTVGVSLGVGVALGAGDSVGVAEAVGVGVSTGVGVGVGSTLGAGLIDAVGVSLGAWLGSAPQAMEPVPATMIRLSNIEAPRRLVRDNIISCSPSVAPRTPRSKTGLTPMGRSRRDDDETNRPPTSPILLLRPAVEEPESSPASASAHPNWKTPANAAGVFAAFASGCVGARAAHEPLRTLERKGRGIPWSDESGLCPFSCGSPAPVP